MGLDFAALVHDWDGEQVVISHDSTTATWMFVCQHSSRLGPATGGTRLRVYPEPAAGLADGLRLAAAMTVKMAMAGMPLGGGKGVLAVAQLPDAATREHIIDRYADLVASLGGSYLTAPDMNTSESDMDRIARRCPYVFSRSVAQGGSGNSAPATAVGVLHGIRASTQHAFGSSELSGLGILVQGLGGVGGHVAELLTEAGARVLVADVDPDRVARAVQALGAAPIDAADVIGTDCDVLAPCAVGGVLDAAAVDTLRCRVVAGAANNQLAEPSIARRLRDRGVLYAPDFVINAGGVLHGVGLEQLGWDDAELQRRLRGIGDTLLTIYREADDAQLSTHDTAERAARRLLGTNGADQR